MQQTAHAFPVLKAVLNHRTSHIEALRELYEGFALKNKNVENISEEERNDYHLYAVNLTLEHVWNHNPYYRRALEDKGFSQPRLESLDQIDRLPFLDKEVIRGDKDLLLSCDPKEIGQIHLTSGTTGKPIYTAYTLADHYIHDAIPFYPSLFEGDSSSDVVGIALPYEFAQPALGFQRLYQFTFGATVLSLGKGGYMAPVDKSLDVLKEYDASILITTPSYAALLAEEGEKLGIVLGEDITPRKLMLTGEGCSPQFASRLKELWKCDIQHLYGSTECGLVGVQLNDDTGYHLLEGNVKVEIVDPDSGMQVADGEEGEVVITTLLREAMPFIRYRTGDIGYLERLEDDSAITLSKLHLRGRMDGNMLVDGIPYSPFMLEHLLLLLPEVGLWYHFVLEDEELTIEIEKLHSDLTDEELADKVRSHMYRTAGISCTVLVKDSLPRQFGKANRIIRKGM
ncbi:phenylacetate--CoA ligase family protein [Mesobacillus foraminis]|uniref:phenylacetate--CoA ligase family protein n=1 Tax=Mesobacillus foraminis TaxID=279826 RepID=UPI000EF4CAEE|nr:AMP-binding protein [Mesobacillus foraminis]